MSSGSHGSEGIRADRGAVAVGGDVGGDLNVHNQFNDAASEVVWPIQVGVMPAPAKAFQPRTAAREQIYAGWHAPSAPPPAGAASKLGTAAKNVRGKSTQMVVGDGGVGKSQLAAAIARDAQGSGTDLVVWVPAGSREQVVAMYAETARQGPALGSDSPDADVAARAFLNWAATTTKSWLVVLDDVTSAAEMRGLWPKSSLGRGRVLVTTRHRGANMPEAWVELGVFAPDESQSYLSGRFREYRGLTSPGVLDEGAELAEDLGHLPVALAQAIAVVLDEGITVAEYRVRFADRSQKLDQLFPDDAGADDYTRTVATTWSLALERAKRLSPIAGRVADLVALLDPAGAPEALFSTDAVCFYLSKHPGSGAGVTRSATSAVEDTGIVTPQAARAGLRALQRLSVISHELTGEPTAVRIHALAQRAITDSMNSNELKRAVQTLADALLQSWPEQERDSTLATVLRANTTRLHTMHPDLLWDPGLDCGHQVLFKMVSSLGETGQVVAAADAAQEMLGHARRVLGSDHHDTLATRKGLAFWRGEAGDAAGAVVALQVLLPDYVRIRGREHPKTLTVRNDLATRRGEAGDAAGAAAAFEELLADCVRVLGSDHPSTLIARGNLATWRGNSGDPAGAAIATMDVLADRLRVLGPDHRNTLITRGNLATWQGLAGDPAGAVEAFEELLADYVRVLGSDHPNTLTTRGNLATWRGQAGDPAGAVEAFEDLLTDRLRILGRDHPDILTTRGNLATWRGQAGDPAGAAATLEDLLTDYVRVLGRDHPNTLIIRENLASWRGRSNDVD